MLFLVAAVDRGGPERHVQDQQETRRRRVDESGAERVGEPAAGAAFVRQAPAIQHAESVEAGRRSDRGAGHFKGGHVGHLR